MLPVSVASSDVRLVPDPARIITKPFVPGGDLRVNGRTRVERIVRQLLEMPESDVDATLESVRARFADRHRDLDALLGRAFAEVERHVGDARAISVGRRLLIGAYFTHEYSVEAAALSNPSMVRAPDQSGVAPGAERFVLSLRAIGEGHVSSIEFRSGIVDARGHVEIERPTRFAVTGTRHSPTIYDKKVFRAKLIELRAHHEIAAWVLDALPEHFTMQELESVIAHADANLGTRPDAAHTTRTIHWLAASNYESAFDAGSALSERVLFPAGPTESHGMEDARFVRFVDDDGVVTYHAPYTAYDGYEILPQLISTTDFVTFRIATLNGPCARNKGIALFPRRIDGRFVALARLDNENNFLMTSDNVHFWHEAKMIQSPARPWEIVQLGNCGSPLETEAGWLVITHGVGAMRQYALGAILLDLRDPTRVLGSLTAPLLEALGSDRDGYVPNVVYSCGSMISGELLVLPYGFADVGTRIATVRLADLLAALLASPPTP
jgi:predicted GH43/DUF377 family glycosyl hydrolase